MIRAVRDHTSGAFAANQRSFVTAENSDSRSNPVRRWNSVARAKDDNPSSTGPPRVSVHITIGVIGLGWSASSTKVLAWDEYEMPEIFDTEAPAWASAWVTPLRNASQNAATGSSTCRGMGATFPT